MFIEIPDTNKVDVTKIKITVQCKICNTEWATYLNVNGSLKNGWNLCRKCSLEKKFGSNTEQSTLNDIEMIKKEIEKNDITKSEENK